MRGDYGEARLLLVDGLGLNVARRLAAMNGNVAGYLGLLRPFADRHGDDAAVGGLFDTHRSRLLATLGGSPMKLARQLAEFEY